MFSYVVLTIFMGNSTKDGQRERYEDKTESRNKPMRCAENAGKKLRRAHDLTRKEPEIQYKSELGRLHNAMHRSSIMRVETCDRYVPMYITRTQDYDKKNEHLRVSEELVDRQLAVSCKSVKRRRLLVKYDPTGKWKPESRTDVITELVNKALLYLRNSWTQDMRTLRKYRT